MMNPLSQVEPVIELKKLASARRQSLIIEGPKGSGKSYLARQFANMLSIEDFNTVSPKVSEIKEAIDDCMAIENNVVICIENLDLGQLSASYTLLKMLEEPISNLFIVITCRNLQGLPDTIISRSAVVSLGPPKTTDIVEYAKLKDLNKYNLLKDKLIWNCIQTFSDCDDALKLDIAKIDYYQSLPERCNFKESVSNIVWAISYYDDNSECNLEFAVKCLISHFNTPFVTQCGVDCLTAINKGRIAAHAVLSKFVFNIKYCE